MKLEEIEKKLVVVETKRQKLRAEQAKALGRKYVTCTDNCYGKGCGKKFQIHNLVYIQIHFYISAYGCTGGDYWKPSEGQFDCPNCDHRNRLYDRKHIEELRPYFSSIEDEHKN